MPTPSRIAAGRRVAYRWAKSTISAAAIPVSAAARSGVHPTTAARYESTSAVW